MEKWLDIPNFNGYQVSNLGRVRTHEKITKTEHHGLRHWKDKILHYKSNSYKTGYRVDLWRDGKPHSFLVARLVAFTFLNKDINDHSLTVNHINGNRFDNKIENLELITLKENIQHGFRTGLYSNNCKEVNLIEKKTGRSTRVYSMEKASRIIGRGKGYISNCIRKGKFENEEYLWKLI